MKTKINVKGMHCKSCENLLKESIQELEGVKKVDVNHQKGEVNVHFDEKKVNIGAIKITIMKEGYKVE